MPLTLRNIIFFILQPGVVCILIPYLLIWDVLKERFSVPFQFYHIIGGLLIALGLGIIIHCIVSFNRYGKGTLSPLDPTKKLVIRGLYKYSRNPMYLGVITLLLGEAVLTRTLMLGAYLFLVTTAFLIYVLVFEEPRLQRDFGKEYDEYKKKVRRWF